MAGAITTTITFADGDQVTSAKLNQIISGTSFTSDAITGTTLIVTGGQLKVGTITASELGGGSVSTAAIQGSAVTAAEIASNAVTTTKVLDGAITYAKVSTGAIGSVSDIQDATASKLVAADSLVASCLVPKAFCTVSTSTTNRVVGNSFHVASATRLSSTKMTVTFDFTMPDSAYCVLATLRSSDGSGTTNLVTSNFTTTSFDITHPAEGAPWVGIHLVVFNI